jgi:hypothetical protein
MADDGVGSVVVEKTDRQILKEYFPWWKELMEKKFGAGHRFITEEKCIEDWVIVHWANKIK